MISVIIPTLNRGELLLRTLESLTHLDCHSDDFEVVVVDNAPHPTSRSPFERMREQSRRTAWRYVHEPTPGLLAARHRGVQQSAGDVCAFIDDDVQVGRDWISAIKHVFTDLDVTIATGPSHPLFGGLPPRWLNSFYTEDYYGRYCGWLSLYDAGPAPRRIHPAFVWGLNFIITRRTLHELGGFHPDTVPTSLQRFQGDGETGLSLEAHRRGLTAAYHPGIEVRHEVPVGRMTVEYFRSRAYFQGVCDSYSKIRETGCASKSPAVARIERGTLRRLARRLLRRPSAIGDEVRRATDVAYGAGYSFHQRAVESDPTVLAWVLRPDYWDYRLPV